MPDSTERLAVSDDGFAFPAEEVVTGRGFVTGKSGSGKSNTASVIVEELLERRLPLMIVDTDGEYVGLQESYDLLRAGGTDACDLQVSREDADQLTTHALEDHASILLDVSTYRDEEETEAVIETAVEALFVAEREYRIPFLLLVEEAHEFVPQQGGSDLKSLLIRVAKRGRKRGLGICALSQRPAAVDKDYITQCNWFVWHRLTWENDTDVVARIIGTESAETVQSLDDGEALVQTDWAESVDRVQFRLRRSDEVGSTPSLEDLDRSGGPAETDDGEGSDGARDDGATGETALVAGERRSAVEETPEGDGGPDAGPTEVRYEESTVAASSLAVPDRKPSLERRRERRQTPDDATDPLWEVGAVMVHCYDSLVWYHARAVSRLEGRVARTVERIDHALVGRRVPRRPGPYERSVYRLCAVLGVVAVYGLLLLSLAALVGSG